MLEYVGPVTALLTGVIGIFYSRAGERQTLGPIAYVLLALIIIASGASLYGVHAAKREAAAKERQARIDAASSAAQLRREKKTADTLRGLLLARAFAEAGTTADAILSVDLTQPHDNDPEAAGPEGPGSEFAPLLGRGISNVRITFNIDDVVEIDYLLASTATGAVIDASYYEYGPRVCRLAGEETGAAFSPVSGSPCTTQSGFVHNALLEAIAPYRALIINLPRKQPFWKMFSRIEQSQRAQPLGSIEVATDSPATARRVLREARTISAAIKFFRPFGDGTECYTTLLVHLALRPQISQGKHVSIAIEEIGDYELNFCEVSPI